MWRYLWSSRTSEADEEDCDTPQSFDECLASMALNLLQGSFDEVAPTIMKRIGELVAADRCYLAIPDRFVRYRLEDYQWSSPSIDEATPAFQDYGPDDLCDLLEQARSQRPARLSTSEIPDHSETVRDFLRHRRVESCLIAILGSAKAELGWLGVDRINPGETWGSAEQAFVQKAADLMGAAYSRNLRETKLSRLAQAVEQSHNVVIITDPNGIIEYVNPQFSESSGYSSIEAVGQLMKIPEHPEIPPQTYRDLWAAVTAGHPWRGELINRHKDGRLYWEMVSISPIRDEDGAITHYVGVKEDITEEKRALGELKEARDEADRANQAKSDFLANMSHEIRTPVNAIIGLTHLVLQSEVSSKNRDHLTKIRASSQNLLTIINAILDYAKIDSGRLMIEEFDFQLDDVLDNLRELLEAKARDKGLELVLSVPVDLPRALCGDPFRLGQILINLSNNAIKFTDRGGVVIGCEALEEKTDSVCLRFYIRDSGIGISPDDIGRLFDPFTQVDSSVSRPFGGTGLGLAIARRLVELMGGEIGVNSTPGKGSEFFFTITVKRQTHESSPLPSVAGLRGMKVLVVDDSRTSRRVLCETLDSFGFEIRAVSSGEAAVHEIGKLSDEERAEYAVILMDWKMPAMDGVEAARRIGEIAEVTPPIILITGYGREDIVHQAENTLFDGFLLKPVNPSLLFDAIMNAVGQDVRSTDQSTATDAKPDHAPSACGRVLVVEDNELNQEVAKELLADLGLEVTIAGNGQEALELLEDSVFDVILMDVQMPVMDGFEATRHIRDTPRIADVPIVAMTAHALTGDRERCLKAGMDDYTTKPISIDHLCAVLSRWIDFADDGDDEAVDAEEDKHDALPEIQGINAEAGLKRIGGNSSLFKKLLVEFYHDYREVVGTVRTALDLGHHESGLRLLHTLKGVAATIGAESVHVAARDLEQGVRSGDEESLQALFNNLARAITPILNALSRFDNERKTSPEPDSGTLENIDFSDVQTIFGDLISLLDEGDPEAADLYSTLAEKLRGSGFANELEMLEQQIENFDFDEACTTCDDLRRRIAAEREAQDP